MSDDDERWPTLSGGMGVTDTDEQLIDVHAHFLTDGYVVAARAAGHVHPDGMASWPNWSAEEHLQLMDRTDVVALEVTFENSVDLLKPGPARSGQGDSNLWRFVKPLTRRSVWPVLYRACRLGGR